VIIIENVAVVIYLGANEYSSGNIYHFRNGYNFITSPPVGMPPGLSNIAISIQKFIKVRVWNICCV